MIATLDEALADVRSRLARAASDRNSPMHMPVVGTADGDLRMMTLRECSGDMALLRFHTDARSPKVGLIGSRSPVSVLAFDPQDKVQLRLRGTGRIETEGPVVEAAWAAASAYARRCYLAETAPSSVSEGPTSGLPAAVEGKRPSDAELIPARANFAVLLIELTSADWLYLAHTGHRRAQFTRGEAGWEGHWLVP